MSLIRVDKDQFGVKYRYPTRDCKSCKRYPCFEGIEKCLSNFAAYGCIYYKDPVVIRYR